MTPQGEELRAVITEAELVRAGGIPKLVTNDSVPLQIRG
jgi:hypothetical protein